MPAACKQVSWLSTDRRREGATGAIVTGDADAAPCWRDRRRHVDGPCPPRVAPAAPPARPRVCTALLRGPRLAGCRQPTPARARPDR
eukprot:scaffold73973_cov65-Phaeocystis_antarctica.AAC.6